MFMIKNNPGKTSTINYTMQIFSKFIVTPMFNWAYMSEHKSLHFSHLNGKSFELKLASDL